MWTFVRTSFSTLYTYEEVLDEVQVQGMTNSDLRNLSHSTVQHTFEVIADNAPFGRPTPPKEGRYGLVSRRGEDGASAGE
ncbi:hypothetical protein GCM10022384_18660 [Streptomyces marokkonensis]|uniref:Uncharacterized protein n=1 Tax=Streptomyces marokkonensis TaxID=324855 RepID=A0ABP7PL59_9ACTN